MEKPMFSMVSLRISHRFPRKKTGFQDTLAVDPRVLPQLRELSQLPAHLLELRHAAQAAAAALEVVEGHEFQDQTSPGKMFCGTYNYSSWGL